MAGITTTTGTGPLIGQGFYPTSAQNAQNYINVMLPEIMPSVIYEGVRKARPTLRLLLKKTQKPLKGGWAPINQPVSFQTFGNNGSWTGMSGSFTIPTITNPIQNLQFLPSLYINPISYLLTEEVMMESPNAVIDVVAQRITDAYETMFDNLNSTILGTMGTNSLQMQGLYDIVDNGTNQSYYGGLTRASYTYLNSKIFAYSAGIFSTTPTAYQIVHRYLLSFLNDTNYRIPDVGITSFAVFSALTESMASIERVQVQDPARIADSRDWAVQVVSVDGVPILPDPSISANTIYFLNLNKLELGTVPQLNFKLTPPADLQPTGQLGFVQTALIAGQFYSFEPAAHFQLTSFPGVTLA
jgi:hypothetical protein